MGIGSWVNNPVRQKCPRCESFKCIDTGFHTEMELVLGKDVKPSKEKFIIYVCLDCGLQFRVWERKTR